jgi:hypothetical protein
MLRRLVGAGACVVVFALAASAEQDTPAAAYKRLQDATKARDLAAMAAALEPEQRALLLHDMLTFVAVVENQTAPERSEALLKSVVALIEPALKASPVDPAYLEGHSEAEQTILLIGWGISKSSLSDAQAIARLITAELPRLDAKAVKGALDSFVEQVPTAPLQVNKQTEDAAWAVAGDHPLGFVRSGGRWYAGGVWFTKKKGGPINALSAYAQLRLVAEAARPGARLRELQTAIYPISATGESEGWFAQFLTDTPGELLTVSYLNGQVTPAMIGTIDPSAKSLPDMDKVSFDLQRIAEAGRKAAPSALKMTAALIRASNSGKAEWIVHGTGDDGKVAWSVFVDPVTLAVTHVSK